MADTSYTAEQAALVQRVRACHDNHEMMGLSRNSSRWKMMKLVPTVCYCFCTGRRYWRCIDSWLFSSILTRTELLAVRRHSEHSLKQRTIFSRLNNRYYKTMNSDIYIFSSNNFTQKCMEAKLGDILLIGDYRDFYYACIVCQLLSCLNPLTAIWVWSFISDNQSVRFSKLVLFVTSYTNNAPWVPL